MNRWMWKSTLTEIRKSLGRYMAILAIVALGVGTFCGLKVIREAMLLTERQYLEEKKLFDLQLYSVLGWTDEDAAAVAEAEGVTAAEAAYAVDFITAGEGDNTLVYKALSITEDLHALTVRAGRLPQAANECLGDRRWFTEEDIGTTITVLDDNDEDTLDAFACREFTLVGVGDTPLYMNFERGSASIGSGTLSAFICVPEEAFAAERYTDIYVTLEMNGAAPYSEEYEALLETLRPGVEAVAEERTEARRDEILQEYEDELANARKELDDGWVEYEDGLQAYEDGKLEADEELANAQAELDNAATQLADGRRQLWDAENKLDEAEERLNDAQTQLDDGKKQLEEGLLQLNTAQAELDAVWAEAQAGRAEFEAQKAETLGQLDAAEAMYQAQYAAARQALENAATPEEIEAAQTSLAEAAYALEALAQQRSEVTAQLQEAEAPLLAAEQQLAAGQAQLDANHALLEEKQAELTAAQAEIDAGRKELEEGRKEINSQWATLYSSEAELEEGRVTFEEEKRTAEEELEEARLDLGEALQQLNDGEAEYNDALHDFTALWNDLTANDLHYVLDRDTNIAYVMFESDSAIVDDIADVFPVFFFLVALLVCMTTMTRMIDEQRTQIGVLKALGYTQSAIFSKYILYAGSSALLGGLIGYFGGSWFFPQVIWYGYSILYGFADIQVVFNPWLGLASLLVALGCSVGAVWFSGRREFANVPAQLMRPKAPAAGKRIFLERLPWFWNRLSFLQKVSVRNLVRYKKRLVMMILGISGCTALVLTGFGIKDSIQNIVHYQFDEITVYDYNVTFIEAMSSAKQGEFNKEMPVAAENVFVHSASYDVTLGDVTKSVNVVAAENGLDGFVNLSSVKMEEVAYPGPGEVVLTQKLASQLHVRVGDTVTLVDEDHRELTATVSGVCRNFVYNYAFLDMETFAQQWGERPEVRNAFVNLPGEEDVHETGAQIASHDQVINVMVSADMETRFGSMMSSLDVVVAVIIGCAGALAFIVLYNLTNINITERVREIATIKVLGFYPNESAAYIFRENIILTALGAFIGLGLGKVFHAFVMSCVVIETVTFEVRIVPTSYLWAVAITMLFSVCISRLMRVKINHINMAESLKSVE
ncbi:MAG: ABC transporter permease [Clostridia bacterium]|nr:ABC transporter permease [Clostridia bacterium]